MRLFTSGSWLLGVLLSFSSVAHSWEVDPTEDFCSLSEHMSRTLFRLLKHLSLFTYQRGRHAVVQKDDILYIAGGWMKYPSSYSDYNGPSLYPFRMHDLLTFI